MAVPVEPATTAAEATLSSQDRPVYVELIWLLGWVTLPVRRGLQEQESILITTNKLLQQAIIMRSSFAHPFMIDPPCNAVYIPADGIPSFAAKLTIHQVAIVLLRRTIERESIARFEEQEGAGLGIGQILLLKLWKALSFTQRSSSFAASVGSAIGSVAKAAKRSGCFFTMSARISFASRQIFIMIFMFVFLPI